MINAANTDFLTGFCERWLDAWNSHNTDNVLALLHPDIEWDDRTFWTHVLHGQTAVRDYVEKIWSAMPDVHFDAIERFFAPDRLRGVVLFRQYGSGPAKLNPAARFDTHACGVFMEFRDGKLSRYMAVYDIVEMMRQLGALPDRGTKIGGAYLLSLMKSPGTARKECERQPTPLGY